MVRTLPVATTLLLMTASTVSLGDDGNSESAPEYRMHTVEAREMRLSVRADSQLEAGETTRVQLLPEAFSGSFEIIAIDRRAGRVEAGQTLMRFDGDDLREQIESAEIALADAADRLQFEQQELSIMHEANATRIERAEKSLADAQLAAELWETFHGDRMLSAANLSTRQRESSVLNQREELAQLQAMYDGTALESDTKEIVLERALRGLAIAEEWLEITREDERITRDHTYGQRARDVRDEVRYREESLDHLRVQSAIGEAKKLMAINQMTRSHEDAVERLEKLRHDKKLLVVKAPVNGLLARIDRETGDRVNARQSIAEIHDTSVMRITFNASPNDLRVLREGTELTVRLPELPEVVMVGRVESIDAIARNSGGSSQLKTEVRIEQPHELARIGLNATVHRSISLGEVLSVPREAVTWDEGVAYVDLMTGEQKQRHEVTLGASNAEAYQVIDGLNAGDIVALPKEN